MLVACRLAGLSALEAHYAEVRVGGNSSQRGAPHGMTVREKADRVSADLPPVRG
jgi:hypothetical protein